mmetsp:Transcript_19553/g.45572  ORF Transcript_19553/g.45572 Transcript_19553/m.45572 type:complete len:269 (+) Transcript_19553:226-1032(+)
MGTNSISSKEALTSMKAKNLYHLSLVCFSFSLLLFVGTYNLIATSCLTATVAPLGDDSCLPHGPIPGSNDGDDDRHKELLIGYSILHDTLKKESQLRYLHWLQGATFRGPKGSLKTILTKTYRTSQTRRTELTGLFRDQEPVIELRDAPNSAMGDSIQKDVEKSSAGELVTFPSLLPPSGDRSSSSSSSSSNGVVKWGIRFALIQAQATRMVVALSTSLMRFEENEVRKRWLSELAEEFEAIRESIVDSILENLGDQSFEDWLGNKEL